MKEGENYTRIAGVTKVRNEFEIQYLRDVITRNKVRRLANAYQEDDGNCPVCPV